MNDLRTRFNKAYWIDEANKDLEILIVGVGGAGSALCSNLIRALPAKYLLMDHDKISAENVSTQNFDVNEVARYKVDSFYNRLYKFANISTIKAKFDKEDTAADITICCVDNMEGRELLFEKWKDLGTREFYVECRLAATCFEIFFVKKGQEELYKQFLFKETEASKVSCFMKQTPQIANLLGAKMTQIICNYLGNKYLGEDIYDVPFYYKEIGELLSMEKKYESDFNSQ